VKRTRIFVAALCSATLVGLCAQAVLADRDLATKPVKAGQPEAGGEQTPSSILAHPASTVDQSKVLESEYGRKVIPVDLHQLTPEGGFYATPVAQPQGSGGSRDILDSDLNLVDVDTTGAVAGAVVFDAAGTRRAGQAFIVGAPANNVAYTATSYTLTFLPVASSTIDSHVQLSFYNVVNLDPAVCTTDVQSELAARVLVNLGPDEDGNCQNGVNGTPFEQRRIDFVTGDVFNRDPVSGLITPKGGNSGVILNTSPIAPAVPVGADNGTPDTAFFTDDVDWRFLDQELGIINTAGDGVVEGPTELVLGTCIDPGTLAEDDCLDRFGLGGIGGPRTVFNNAGKDCPSGDASQGGINCPLAGKVAPFFHIDNDNNGSFDCGELFGFGLTTDTINFAIRGGSGPDCDDNLFVDAYDIALDPTLDDGGDCPTAIAGNGIPDPCECLDCNSNGVDDATDIAGATSEDCNSNGVPDDCELAARDCNNNLIPDDCDIAGATSADCQPNFIPDECDTNPTDPDGNGFFSVDCDGFPDGAINIGDGVPDSCQRAFTDCNINGVDDICDIAQGVSNDFDADGAPDECDDPNSHLLDVEPSALVNFDYNANAVLNKQPFPNDPGNLAFFFRQWFVADFTTNGFDVNVLGSSDVVPGSLGTGTQKVRLNLTALDGSTNSVRQVISRSPILAFADTTGLQQFSGGIPTRQETSFLFQVASGGPAAGNLVFNFGSFADDFINSARFELQLRTSLAADCNNNGLADVCDIACSSIPDAICGVTNTGGQCGLSTDIDSNGVPDDCQTDCNTNGVPDAFEVAQGQVNDTNGDGIPDGCQPSQADCNNNGVADGTDIAMGTSLDCDLNLTPDECQLATNDFNNNGIPDVCDIANCGSQPLIPDCNPVGGVCTGCTDVVDENLFRSSVNFTIADKPRCDEDVDSNGIPDFCQDVNSDGIVDSAQLANCNGNQKADGCEICVKQGAFCASPSGANTFSVFFPAATCAQVWGIPQIGSDADCNVDKIADSCQLTGNDDDANGVPDDCQADCNTNGIIDDLEVSAGSAMDCDANGVPDECDVDCDTNGVVDACDFIGTTGVPNFTDCNGNLIPDACDTDCDNNGIVDECDFTAGVPNFPDCNTNEIPDACDEDCNNNGNPDVCDIDLMGVVDCNGDCIPDSCQLAGNDCNINGQLDICENPISVPGQVPGCLEFNPGAPITPVVLVDARGTTAVTSDTLSWTSSTGVQTVQVIVELPEILTVNFPGDTNFLNSTGEVLVNGTSLGKFRPNLSSGPALIDTLTTEWQDNRGLLGSQVLIKGAPFFPSDLSVDTGLSTSLTIDLDDISTFRSHEDITCEDLFSEDCDNNGVCDSFELAAPGADQNANGILDVCEGVCNDCNLNNIPDDVEIANGTATDTTPMNGVPDVCDITDFSTGFESPDFETNGGEAATPESIDTQQGWAVFSGSASPNFARIREAATASTLGFPTEGTHWLTLRDLGGGDTDAVAISPRGTLPDSRIELWCWNMRMTSNGFGRFMVELADLCEDGPLAAPTMLAGIDPNPGGGDGEDQPGEPYFDAINTGLEFRGNNAGLVNPNTVSMLTNPGGGKDYGVEVANQAANFTSVRTACLKIKDNGNPTDAIVESIWASGVISPPFGFAQLLAVGRVETGFPTGGDRQIIFRHANQAEGSAQMFVDNLTYTARPDCDRDGLSDSIYIGDSVPQDKNANGILDRCEDCNNDCTWTASGVSSVACLDQAEIIASGGALDPSDPTCTARGGSIDCNNNCIPDECDVAAPGSVGHFPGFVSQNNCPNDLGIPGPCDVFRNGGDSCDSDANGVPDECQVALCMMGSNGCQDCNGNGCLDSGDIAGATSNDINLNERPDECDGDCNVNGVLDPLDIIGGTSTDVNADDIPDECCTIDKDGDFDQDNDVDDADYQVLQLCEGVVVGGDDECGCADLNDDGFVDEIDVLLFQRLVTGP